VLHERGLHGVEVLRRAQPLDGRDAVALVHDRESQAGGYPSPIDDHRARAASALITALLGAGQMQVLAQCVEQGGSRIELKLPACPVYVEGHVHGLRRRWRITPLRLRGNGREHGKRGRGRPSDQNVPSGHNKSFGFIHGSLLLSLL
jgi:hypothetical protein